MSQDNQITLRGYVVADPKFGQTAQKRTPVAEIRVGSTPRWLDRSTGEWQDGDPSYYTVKCWRRLAINVAGSLRKGDMVLIRGKVVTRRWLDDQQRTHVQMEVEADSVGHDLTYGWSHFNRGVQGPWNNAQRLAAGELARQEQGEPPADDQQLSGGEPYGDRSGAAYGFLADHGPGDHGPADGDSDAAWDEPTEDGDDSAGGAAVTPGDYSPSDETRGEPEPAGVGQAI